MTCEHLTADRGEELLTLFRAGFPAKESHKPDPARDLMTRALDSGKNRRESFAKWDGGLDTFELRMTTLAFLQCQWFRDPVRVRAMLADKDDKFRWSFIAKTLFMGCRTGVNLERVFGNRIDSIIWEETSRDIGGKASAKFPPEPVHMRRSRAAHWRD